MLKKQPLIIYDEHLYCILCFNLLYIIHYTLIHRHLVLSIDNKYLLILTNEFIPPI